MKRDQVRKAGFVSCLQTLFKNAACRTVMGLALRAQIFNGEKKYFRTTMLCCNIVLCCLADGLRLHVVIAALVQGAFSALFAAIAAFPAHIHRIHTLLTISALF